MQLYIQCTNKYFFLDYKVKEAQAKLFEKIKRKIFMWLLAGMEIPIFCWKIIFAISRHNLEILYIFATWKQTYIFL